MGVMTSVSFHSLPLFLASQSASSASSAPPSAETPLPPAADKGAPASTDYEVGPQDILRVTVYGHEDLTQTVLVQPDGTFIFPLIGRVKASEMTPAALERKIAILLAQGFIRSPQVTVSVQEYRSKSVFVVGEVARPGTYPLSGSMSLVEVLGKAGPLTGNAAAEVIVVRPWAEVTGPVLPNEVAEGEVDPEKKGAEVIRVNIRDIQAGELEKNLTLKPNDTIFVPQAPKVFVSGEVRNPGAYPFIPGTTVRQAISLAGGVTQDGSQGRIRVVREVEGKTKEVKIKLDEPIQPGDTIVVKAKLF
jgi:polysaccharide export outer membrane protein